MYYAIEQRHMKMASGLAMLRAHLPPDAPLKTTMVFADKRWQVRVQFLPENHEALVIGMEDLGAFPSDALIAQAMLVA